MEHADWDSVMQFVSEPMDMSDYNLAVTPGAEKPVAERTERQKLGLPSPQFPTPPVCFYSHTAYTSIYVLTEALYI